MAQDKKKSPAVEAAKERLSRDQAATLSTGVKARFVPIAATLLADVASRTPDPPIPTWFNPEKEREEENPFDPEYLSRLRDVEAERTKASLDAIVLFGVEIVDEIPDEGEWLDKIRFMEKRGHIDISEYDLSDPLEKEFVYKRYIAVSSDDIIEVCRRSGITEEDIATAIKSFPSS